MIQVYAVIISAVLKKSVLVLTLRYGVSDEMIRGFLVGSAAVFSTPVSCVHLWHTPIYSFCHTKNGTTSINGTTPEMSSVDEEASTTTTVLLQPIFLFTGGSGATVAPRRYYKTVDDEVLLPSRRDCAGVSIVAGCLRSLPPA